MVAIVNISFQKIMLQFPNYIHSYTNISFNFHLKFHLTSQKFAIFAEFSKISKISKSLI